MKYLYTFLFLLTISSIATAQEVTPIPWDGSKPRELVWEYESEEVASKLLRYKLYRDNKHVANINSAGVNIPPPLTYRDTTFLSIGTHSYQVSAVSRDNGLESDKSNSIFLIVISTPTPTPIVPMLPPAPNNFRLRQ